ncbi:hypothetical protein VPH35_041947 [Triticum aestivum]
MSENEGADLNPCLLDRSWPASPLDNDDLLGEILLLLPPLPSSLRRASAVCQHWRRLTTDPQFLCRFRTHHRKEGPPVLGAFLSRNNRIVFRSSISDPADRIPPKRINLECCNHRNNVVLDCRHGRVLVYNPLPRRQDIVVCDPIAGDQRCLPVPPEFKKNYPVNGAVFCADDAHDHVHGSCHSSPFKVALMSNVYMVKLKSMQYNKLYEGAYHINYHPFKSFCAPGTTIAGG